MATVINALKAELAAHEISATAAAKVLQFAKEHDTFDLDELMSNWPEIIDLMTTPDGEPGVTIGQTSPKCTSAPYSCRMLALPAPHWNPWK
jgi:hypothetical protein